MRAIDATFLDLPAELCAAAALEGAQSLGATWTDIRVSADVERHFAMRDGAVENTDSHESLGLGVRVIVDGSWGFASTTTATPAAALEATQRAVVMARSLAPLVTTPVQLADEPVARGIWVGPYDLDPVAVADAEIAELFRTWTTQLTRAAHINHVTCTFAAAKERTFYADSAGTATWQQRVRCHPQVSVVAITEDGFDDMTTTLPPQARGWEYPLEPAWQQQIDEIPRQLAERIAAPTLAPGRYDLVIHPSNLWLTIHESVGHATEYDRAVGFEANYAGTSFATPDQLGSLCYGSELMHITGDRTAQHGLATVAWDHEGVAAGKWDIVRDGVLVGYQLDRWGAAGIGAGRSNGCAYADDPSHVPLQRMPNVSLAPAESPPAESGPDVAELIAGVTDGLLVEGDKSWSIDMRRRNFQFTAQRFWRIRNGMLDGQVKDIAYQSDTLDFWRSLVALGGQQTYMLGGAVNCGKGQPGQVAPVSHGCPAAVFEGVNVLTTGRSS